jgi:hypothetical protein
VVRPVATVLLALAAMALAPSAALAQKEFLQIYADFQKTGKIDGCRYPQATLKQAKSDIPKDFEQYSPDFENALDAALQQRATGACKKDTAGQGADDRGGAAAPPSTTPTTPSAGAGAGAGKDPAAPAAPAAGQPAAPPASTPQPTPDPLPSTAASDAAIAEAAGTPAAATTADEAPAPLLLLAIVGGLALLAGIAIAAARFLAWEPAWLVRSKHATSEAGWRLGNAWSEFTDWVRLGR